MEQPIDVDLVKVIREMLILHIAMLRQYNDHRIPVDQATKLRAEVRAADAQRAVNRLDDLLTVAR